MTNKKASPVKCARDAMAYPPECFSLKTDGRKAKHLCEKRRAVFIQFALYADGDGTRSWPGNKRIAEQCGLSERTTKRLIADLVALGCATEAVGPDGKVKLHGPRGTTERLVIPGVLPLPGSGPWFDGPDGKRHRVKLTKENIGPLTAAIRGLILGEAVAPDTKAVGPNSASTDGAVGPNSKADGPNSTPVGPNSIAVGPKPADFGPQPPPVPTPTATTTATKPSGPGAGAGVASKTSGQVRPLASKIISYIAGQLGRTSLPSTPQQRKELEALAASAPASILTAATEGWCRERDINGLKFPLTKYLEEIQDYVTAAVAAANAPPPGEYLMTPEEIAADQLRTAQQNGFETVEEWQAWYHTMEQDVRYETLGEEIMRDLGLLPQDE